MSKSRSFTVVFLFVLLFLSCNDKEQNLNSALESPNPVAGIWENKNYTEGFRDTVITFYQFWEDNQFEYARSRFRNGQYEDTLYEGGSYSIPVSSLLLLSYEYKRQGNNQPVPISKNDTLVFTSDNFIDLILWGTTRSFEQISGQAGKLWGGVFYGAKKHFDVYLHNKFVFKNDSAYFYSTHSAGWEEPGNWPEPFKNRVTIFGGLITFYADGVWASSNGYALYKSTLIFTYTQKRYRRRF